MLYPNEISCVNCNFCNVKDDSIFSVLKQEELDELQNNRSHIIFDAGELIFKERQRPSGIYILLEGKVKISKYGFEGKEHIVRFSRKGDILGYRALLGDESYSCSAIAITETQLCFLPKETLNNILQKNTELAFAFLKWLANDLRIAEEKSIRIAQKPVRERIAESLLLLVDVYGYEQDKTTINISMKRDELAGISGTTRETTTRVLSDFSSEGYIDIEKRKIRVKDINGLQKIANQSF